MENNMKIMLLKCVKWMINSFSYFSCVIEPKLYVVHEFNFHHRFVIVVNQLQGLKSKSPD